MNRPYQPRGNPQNYGPRINGKIRAKEVRVVGDEGKQLGVMQLGDALTAARQAGVDLVEIAPNAVPPVCRLVDYGKYKYEQNKKEKESKKHQAANVVKEVQLTPRIDPHDLSIKVAHAVDFMCEDMKVKVALKFKGREMAHKEFGFEVIKKFIEDTKPWGHPDNDPRLNGRTIVLMMSPLPKNKRAKHPRADSSGRVAENPNPPKAPVIDTDDDDDDEGEEPSASAATQPAA